MVSLAALWLPILLSAVFVFRRQSVIHMLLPYHRSDYRQLPERRQDFLAALRRHTSKTGLYVFPFCTPQGHQSPALIEKAKAGAGRLHHYPPQRPARYAEVSGPVVRLLSVNRILRRLSHRTQPVPSDASYLAVFRVAGDRRIPSPTVSGT